MDDRTLEQKLRDTALHSEHRTIGHRMSRKVLVIAPTRQEAQDWAHRNRVAFPDMVYVGPHNWSTALQGVRGLENVVLRWGAFSEQDRRGIRTMLELIESVPFEYGDDDELLCADLVRD